MRRVASLRPYWCVRTRGGMVAARPLARGPAKPVGPSSISPPAVWNTIWPRTQYSTLLIAVLMPAVGLAGAVSPPVRGQALGTHHHERRAGIRRSAQMSIAFPGPVRDHRMHLTRSHARTPVLPAILPDQGSHVSVAAFRFTVRRTIPMPVRSRTRRHTRPACRHADPDGRAPCSRENHPGQRTRRDAPGETYAAMPATASTATAVDRWMARSMPLVRGVSRSPSR